MSCSLAMRRRVERDALLQHAAQVARADAEADLREVETACVDVDGARQDRLALDGRECRGQRVLDVAEGARADASVLGDGDLLLGRADLDIRLEREAVEDR